MLAPDEPDPANAEGNGYSNNYLSDTGGRCVAPTPTCVHMSRRGRCTSWSTPASPAAEAQARTCKYDGGSRCRARSQRAQRSSTDPASPSTRCQHARPAGELRLECGGSLRGEQRSRPGAGLRGDCARNREIANRKLRPGKVAVFCGAARLCTSHSHAAKCAEPPGGARALAPHPGGTAGRGVAAGSAPQARRFLRYPRPGGRSAPRRRAQAHCAKLGRSCR